jgi:tyrosyl-DNA phosphodiesterase 2
VLDALVERRAAEHKQGGGAGVKCRNALFMGDTNWDESTDGQVPLPDGWSDAWLTHGGGCTS